MTIQKVHRILGYLSGAPRVSTRPEAAASGPRSHMLGVMRAFERLGWEVQQFIVGDQVPLSWVTKEADVELSSSYAKRLIADLARLGMAVANRFLAVWKVRQVDWVYERFGAFQFLGYGFQRRGIPWILETNGLFFNEAIKDRSTLALASIERHLEIWAYKQADVIISVTDELKSLLIRHGINPQKILVVPNGVDIEYFNPERFQSEVQHLLSQHRRPIIGFVGTLVTWQGLDLLIQAIADLRSEGLDYNLVVVGDGPMRAYWEQLARELGIYDRIKFLGRVPGDKVPSYIAGFDLTFSGQVILSSGEMYHSPLKLYEYMAMGKPVVASAFTDAKRLVREGKTGYLFEPGNLEDLKRVLRQAYAEQEAWPEMGKKARAEVVAKHSWEARVREMVPKIEAILEAKYGTPYPARRGNGPGKYD
ncbi:MAG: glycosyltransferase family 4 protein [Gammaproteobacteria bacterium]|nr:glycosyltransferase family 4 protein [Gammaproteobacteria bacterium]